MEFREGFGAKLEVPAGKKDAQEFDDKLPGFGIRKFRSHHALNAKDNFQFERRIYDWKRGFGLVDMRRKK